MSTCVYCGKTLIVKNIRGRKPKFCDSVCKERYRLKINKAQLTDETCLQCGNLLNRQQVDKGSKYCSQSCAHNASRTLKGTVKICVVCGNIFEPRSAIQIYCSIKCSHVISREILKSRVQRKHYKCKYCGKDFAPRGSDRITYCSRECAFADRAAKPKPLKEPKLCKWCKQPTPSQKQQFCSNECQRDMAKAKSREWSIAKFNSTLKPRQCKCCGKTFVPAYSVKFRIFCSYRCSKTFSRRIANSTRRAREKNLPYEAIDPFSIFKRDEWKCHICGEQAPQSLRGTIHPLAPELDHIMPLSKGGHHIKENVACCHRKCNLLKSDKLLHTLEKGLTG